MSTAPITDPRPHSDVLRTAVDTALGEWVAYRHDQVPTTSLPLMYAIVYVDRRSMLPRRAGAYAGRSAWRVVVRCVGSTPREAQWVIDRTQDALEEAVFTVSGMSTTPLWLETPAPEPESDDGRYSSVLAYTYTL